MNKAIKVKKDCIELSLDGSIYSNEIIFAAGYVFLDRCYILLDKDKNKVIVYLYPQKKKTDLKQLGLEFYNELLNYGHYFSRTKSNAAVIKTIMQRVMFSAAPSLVDEAQDKEIKALIEELEEEGKENHA